MEEGPKCGEGKIENETETPLKNPCLNPARVNETERVGKLDQQSSLCIWQLRPTSHTAMINKWVSFSLMKLWGLQRKMDAW